MLWFVSCTLLTSVPRGKESKEPPEGFLSNFALNERPELQEEGTVTFVPSPRYALTTGGQALHPAVACVFVEADR